MINIDITLLIQLVNFLISLAIINMTGLDIAQDKLEAVGRRLEEAMSSSCWSTVDEPDDSLPMVGIAASLYDVLKG